jgi:hypothetical protein
MRNIFDQYTQPENKITHALVTGFHEEPSLLKAFVKWVTGSTQNSLQIVEQRLPGESEVTEDEAEKRGLPDAWIYSDDNWSLILESKVAAKLTLDQLERHYATALKRGFDNTKVLAIDVIKPNFKLPNWVSFVSWSEVYTWLVKQATDSYWAKHIAKYLEVAEIKFAEESYLKEGTLTTFSGFPFTKDNPYNYYEAKRVLKLAMERLRLYKELGTELGIDLAAGGRSAITGKEYTAVWDYLSLKAASEEKSHTKYPHFTLTISSTFVYAFVTIPNGVKPNLRRSLFNQGFESYLSVLAEVTKQLNKVSKVVPNAIPTVGVVQRYYKSQRSIPRVDAKLEFDLRTAFPDSKSKVKCQPAWLQTTYDVFSSKKANTQMTVGMKFHYEDCPELKDEKILKAFVLTWLGTKPLINGMFEDLSSK